ncbi:hypothetical protein BN1723_018709 [Verticillium longisporum]|uniref:Uncharacterized protein n=1 Tax=Verticillium longisporum TaxID=100787 RepID=A0A0G4MXT7_VERLO|nr:hypothetical protein BN1723_018709 [Verticillium longisporum]
MWPRRAPFWTIKSPRTALLSSSPRAAQPCP